MGQGLCQGQKLWTTVGRRKLESLTLDPWASRRRRELLGLLDQLDPWIEELDRAVITEAESRPEAVRLMQQQEAGFSELDSDRSRMQSCSRRLNFPQTPLEKSAFAVIGDQRERPQVALGRFD